MFYIVTQKKYSCLFYERTISRKIIRVLLKNLAIPEFNLFHYKDIIDFMHLGFTLGYPLDIYFKKRKCP